MTTFGDIAAAQAALVNPATTAQDLMSIAQTYPSLWADVARHPNAYPDLLVWLGQVGGADVQQAIADREVVSALPPVPPPPPVAEPPAPTPEPSPGVQSVDMRPVTAQAVPAASSPAATANADDSGSFGWAVLGFFVPVVGLILWLVWMRTRPRSATMSRNGFIVGLAVSIVATVTSVAIVLHVARQFDTEPYLPYPTETGQFAATGSSVDFPQNVPYPTPVTLAEYDFTDAGVLLTPGSPDMHVTLTIGAWVSGEQPNVLSTAWAEVGGQGPFPSSTPFDMSSAAYAFGTATYSIIGTDKSGVNGSFQVVSLVQDEGSGQAQSIDTSALGMGYLWAYSQNNNPYDQAWKRFDPPQQAFIGGPGLADLQAGTVAVPFVIAVDQVFTSDYPTGNPALDDLKVSAIYFNKVYQMSTVSWNWVLPDQLWW